MMNLLVVSSDETYLESVKAALGGRGYNILPAKTGEIALEYVRAARGTFHCALVSFLLPGMDGLGLVKILRQEGERMGVVMVSEDGKTAVEKQCEGLEIWTTLYKHTNPEIVENKLMEAFSFTNLSPDKEAAIVESFTREFAKVETLHRDLLEETSVIPLAG